MGTWLDHPAAQAGVVPFTVAVVWALLVSAWRHPALAALGVSLGFLLTVMLVTGLGWQPMTSTRKLVWAVLAMAAFAFACHALCPPRRLVHNLAWVFAGGAALWMVWPAAQYRGGWAGVMVGGGALVYSALLTALGDALSRRAPANGLIAWILPLAAGLVCLLGASALLGQLGLALGSAALALWLVALWRPLPMEAAVLPAVFGAALVALAGAVYARVPVPSLVMLGLAPLAAWLPRPPRFANELLYRLVTLSIPAILAVGWTLITQGPPPL